MPITTCVKVEWKDIFLNGAVFKNTEDIPVNITVKSINNESLINSIVTLTLCIDDYDVIKSTSDGTLSTISISNDKLELSVKLTPEDDLWPVPIDCVKYRINYVIDIITPDGCKLCIGSGSFYIEQPPD